LLKGAAFVGTQDAGHGPIWRHGAFPAQPLTFRNVRNAVAVLVHRKVASITEHDRIQVLTLTIVTNGAIRVLRVFVFVGSCTNRKARRNPLDKCKPLLFQAIKNNLKGLVTDNV